MHYLKYKDLFISEDNIVDQFHNGKAFHPTATVRGEIKCVLRDANLNYITETPWGPNLVTNNALSSWVTPSTGDYSYFRIGTGSTPPAVTDIALDAEIASGNSLVTGSEVIVIPSTANGYVGEHTVAKRIYGGEGTIREFGFSANSTSNLSVRSLLPTPLAKTADQVVDVYHRMITTYDVVDKTGVFVFQGEDYNYKVGLYRLVYVENCRIMPMPFSGYDNYYYNGKMLRSDGNHEDFGLIDDLRGYTVLASQTDADGASNYQYTYDYDVGYATVDVDAFVGLTRCNNVGALSAGGITGTFFQLYGSEINKPCINVQMNRVSDAMGLVKDDTQTLTFSYGASFGRVGSLIP
jgi:hypothetical protein